MGLPIIVAALAAKKVVAFGLYKWGSNYGWTRVYRRALEANKRYTPPQQQNLVKQSIKTSFLFPTQFSNLLKTTPLGQLVSRYVEENKKSQHAGTRALAQLGEFLSKSPDEMMAVMQKIAEQSVEKVRRRGTAAAGAGAAAATSTDKAKDEVSPGKSNNSGTEAGKGGKVGH